MNYTKPRHAALKPKLTRALNAWCRTCRSTFIALKIQRKVFTKTSRQQQKVSVSVRGEKLVALYVIRSRQALLLSLIVEGNERRNEDKIKSWSSRLMNEFSILLFTTFASFDSGDWIGRFIMDFDFWGERNSFDEKCRLKLNFGGIAANRRCGFWLEKSKQNKSFQWDGNCSSVMSLFSVF